MTTREIEEYRVLRDTIRERGTARHWIVVVGLVAWCGLALAASAFATAPVTTLLPLVVLAGTFEIIVALHTAVERVGRYLQVFHEGTTDAVAWEHVVMAYGRAFPGGGIDALFSPLFAIAAVFNLVPMLLAGPAAIDWAIVVGIHLLFIVRIWVARRQSGRQRAIDLARFERIKADRAGTAA